jgi:hypothetical protein
MVSPLHVTGQAIFGAKIQHFVMHFEHGERLYARTIFPAHATDKH